MKEGLPLSLAEGPSHAGSPILLPPPPARLSPKRRDDGRKTGSQRSSGSRSPSPSGGSGWGSPQQNGGSRQQRSAAHGGRPGPAHSQPDVRTLRFAEGSRAEQGPGGRGAGSLPPVLRPPLTGSPREGSGVCGKVRGRPAGSGHPRAWQTGGQRGANPWDT